ncbi:putative nucleoporin [Stipitochalara longipes BDJ]|nr:putative nucleoporin [Stipitochalara longipes BDJ]
MAFPGMQTPQRPLPGAYFNTPAASRFQSGAPIRQPMFQPQGTRQPAAPNGDPSQPVSQSREVAPPQAQKPIQRAARTINEVLQREASFPDLDSYVRQGISSDYDLPNNTTEAAWSPFQRTKMFDIPDKIFEQYNMAEVSTMMGLFAELNHAWVAIDSALYIWDYTDPNAEIIGYEEQNNNITAVKLVTPKAGVFVKDVTHLLVVATVSEMILIGVASKLETSTIPGSKLETPGIRTVALYLTGMSISVRGINVECIEGSAATGRIFFSGKEANEIHELTYQQQEGWFASRCGKINHTSPGYTSLVPAIWGSKTREHIIQIVVDDTRRLIYTLSSESCIRTFHMDSPTTLQQVIEKKKQECLRDISHMISQSSLLTNTMRICSISSISAKEGSKLHLMATTTTGCRLFLSATRGYGYLTGQGAPQSMQVQHIKFPPRLEPRPPGQQLQSYPGAEPATETGSLALAFTKQGLRFPPGFFFCFVTKNDNSGRDSLFLAGPDTGRIAARVQDLAAQGGTKYFEQACWISLNSTAEDVGLVTKPFAAASQPLGFGNELAVQYDEPPTEVAILTNNGIHIIRRRRLVDIFAAAIRNQGGDEALEAEIKKFIRHYGRGETTATALAVACGQGNDVTPGDPRLARVSDPETLELARKCFVEFGGRPSLNENMVAEGPSQAIDNVRPSSRHEGLALYMARLVRSLWKASVITQVVPSKDGGPMKIKSTVTLLKLTSVQDDLTKLATFLEKNKSFIEGLAGPEGLQRVASQQEEIALQGEHQALHSLQKLNSSIIEGISFVQMLFDERIDEIWTLLEDSVKQRLRELTYELLFSSDQGKDLAKLLVKAIVNRNIARGASVDVVADALRRRCGSFCSADDAIIFKAQELLNKAAEAGGNSDGGRSHLNESLRLFNDVAGALSFETLQNACDQYTTLGFYAGAISLALHVASESDRGNRALAWVNEKEPANDARIPLYNFRKRCYNLVHQVILAVDAATSAEPDVIDGRPTLAATKRSEAHDVVNNSDDELFQFGLYEWYLSQGWEAMLLAVNSHFVIEFLTRSATTDVERADLLWRYYTHRDSFYEAAVVQLELAKSEFTIPLAKRVEYLSRAKANASAQSQGIGRQARQVLLYEVTELLDVANIQDELLHRLNADERVPPVRKQSVAAALDGQILNLTELYNEYADQASYFDICLTIYEAASHRNEADISATWQSLIDATHQKALTNNGTQQPYEAIVNMMRDMAHRLSLSETTFSPNLLIPMIETYAIEYQNNVGPRTWVEDLFISIGFPYETIVATIQGMWYNNVAPFTGTRKLVLARHIIYVLGQWYEDCIRSNTRLFGSDENADEINQLLDLLKNENLNAQDRDALGVLQRKISRAWN